MGALGPDPEVSGFREALGRHLLAIEKRDLQALADTLVRSKREFLEAHRGWFALENWTLQAKPVEFFEKGDLGVAVLHLDYREQPAKREQSYLTLVFERRTPRCASAR